MHMDMPMNHHCFRLLLLLAALSTWAAAGAAPSDHPDPMARWRARVEAARLATVPAPPKGVRDLQWQQLSPPGWNPGQILTRLGVDSLQDSDPASQAKMLEIRQEWDRAPVVAQVEGTTVRLTGFPLVLDEMAGSARTILVAPYYGACVHKPAPPANQMVVVALKNAFPANMQQQPLWITGKLVVQSTPTRYGRAAYLMVDAKWEPYPYQKYPLPQYQQLR